MNLLKIYRPIYYNNHFEQAGVRYEFTVLMRQPADVDNPLVASLSPLSRPCCLSRGSRHTRCSADQAPYQRLFGPAALEERLGHVRLLVSPGSFLQVNVPAAERLYAAVEESARLTPASVLLDLCCGTGEPPPHRGRAAASREWEEWGLAGGCLSLIVLLT